MQYFEMNINLYMKTSTKYSKTNMKQEIVGISTN